MLKLKLSFLVVTLLLVTNVSNSSPGWFSQNSGTTEILNDVFFINSLTGWAVGDTGIIIKTTNGGNNWFQQTNPNDKHLRAVRFINENTGWAVGGESYYNPFCEDYIIILKTTNGGTNWEIQVSGSGNIYYDLCLTGPNTTFVSSSGLDIYCMGTEGTVIYTTNGGVNWNGSPDIGYGFGYKSVNFINQNTGWALGYNFVCTPPVIRKIIRTTNGGINWSTTSLDSVYNWNFHNESIKKLIFINTFTGYLIDDCIRKTTDGGYNWFNADSASTVGASGHFYINKDTGWMVRSNPIKRTDNGGLNWSSQYTPISAGLNSIYFINKNTGWAVGWNGTIFKTITGGITSIKQISTLVPDKNALLQNYPNPFNPTSKIKMHIAKSSAVSLIVYDALGKEITTLVNEQLSPGTYEVEFDGSDYPSGVYFYQLQAGYFIDSRKMVMLK